jgi:hypothetical protein
MIMIKIKPPKNHYLATKKRAAFLRYIHKLINQLGSNWTQLTSELKHIIVYHYSEAQYIDLINKLSEALE